MARETLMAMLLEELCNDLMDLDVPGTALEVYEGIDLQAYCESYLYNRTVGQIQIDAESHSLKLVWGPDQKWDAGYFELADPACFDKLYGAVRGLMPSYGDDSQLPSSTQ